MHRLRGSAQGGGRRWRRGAGLLQRLQELGAHVVAEHTVGESFSGDGLIAVSFDKRDRDLVVDTSRARQGDSLFGGLEHDLARAWGERDSARSEAAELRTALSGRDHELERQRRAVADLEEELDALRRTRLFRYAERPRRSYAGLRSVAARRRA